MSLSSSFVWWKKVTALSFVGGCDLLLAGNGRGDLMAFDASWAGVRVGRDAPDDLLAAATITATNAAASAALASEPGMQRTAVLPLLKSITAAHGRGIVALASSESLGLAASAAADGVRIWDLATFDLEVDNILPPLPVYSQFLNFLLVALFLSLLDVCSSRPTTNIKLFSVCVCVSFSNQFIHFKF